LLTCDIKDITDKARALFGKFGFAESCRNFEIFHTAPTFRNFLQKKKTVAKLRLIVSLLIKAETLVESVYTTAGINELLSAGEKRMTF
jgi:hypothetical protein